MIYVEHVEQINASAESVWQYIDWPNMDLMRPGGFFLSINYEEKRPLTGATRRILLSNGTSILERLEEYDDVGFLLAYRILDTGGMPIADYLGQVRITACGSDASFIKFSSQCSPVGLSESEWEQTYKKMQAASAAFIRSQLVS